MTKPQGNHINDLHRLTGLNPMATFIHPMVLPQKLVDLYKASLIKYLQLSDEYGTFYKTDGITIDHCAGLIITLTLDVFPVYQDEITSLRALRIGQDSQQRKILIQSPVTLEQAKFDFTKGTMEDAVSAFNDVHNDRLMIMMAAQFNGPTE